MTAARVIASGPWSAPESWPGVAPQAGQIVTIPLGTEILLDIDPPSLAGLVINGTLTFGHRDIQLTSPWILIDGGTLNIGSPDRLHTHQVVLTLTGTNETESVGEGVPRHLGTKFIGVINGGSLEVHGARARSRNWTQLSEPAPAGSVQLRVADPVAWKVGDHLAIAPSGFDPADAEEVTITSVAGNTIQFQPPLRHAHWGVLQTIGGHSIDERAEVACLTRNLVIQGDEASSDSNFGGHLMFGSGTSIHLEGVEFRRMGQKGHAGRYPIHWHVAGNQPGDYARGNSIHHSYHRAIVVHGTSQVRVENNVSYDVWSHAFVPSEDGSERDNQFVNNLAILTRRLAPADYGFPGIAPGSSFQSEGRPGAFWLKSPQQVLIGNHAAGVIDGMGFFYDGGGTEKVWTGSFLHNTAHACSGPSGSLADLYSPTTRGFGLFMENHSQPAEILFQGFTGYKNTLAALWLEAPGQRVREAVLADNGTGAILEQSTLEDSVIVGQSANTIGFLTPGGTSTGGVHLSSDERLKAPQLRNLDFINQRDAGIVVRGKRLHPLSVLQNLRFTDTRPCRIEHPDELIGGFTDLDGSLRRDGTPIYIHGLDSLVTTAGTHFAADLNAWITPLNLLQYISLVAPQASLKKIGFTVLESDVSIGELADSTLSFADSSVSGYVVRNRTYGVLRFDSLPQGVRVSSQGRAPDFVQLEIPIQGSAFVYEEATPTFDPRHPDFARLAPQAPNLADYGRGVEFQWFDDSATTTLHLRLAGHQDVYLYDQPTDPAGTVTPLALWQYQHFGVHALNDPDSETVWGETSDPDADGLPNLTEFFLGTDPWQSGNPIVFDPVLPGLSFPRNPAATDFLYSVSYSSDLVTWQTDTELAERILPNGSIQVTAVPPVLPKSGSLFLKLQVHTAP